MISELCRLIVHQQIRVGGRPISLIWKRFNAFGAWLTCCTCCTLFYVLICFNLYNMLTPSPPTPVTRYFWAYDTVRAVRYSSTHDDRLCQYYLYTNWARGQGSLIYVFILSLLRYVFLWCIIMTLSTEAARISFSLT